MGWRKRGGPVEKNRSAILRGARGDLKIVFKMKPQNPNSPKTPPLWGFVVLFFFFLKSLFPFPLLNHRKLFDSNPRVVTFGFRRRGGAPGGNPGAPPGSGAPGLVPLVVECWGETPETRRGFGWGGLNNTLLFSGVDG